MSVFTFLIIFYAVFLLISSAIFIVKYLLQAIALYKMASNMGLSNPWISFIPFAEYYAFGRIAEKYIKNDGRPSAKFSKILLTLGIITAVVAIAIMIFVLIFYSLNTISAIETTAYSEELHITAQQVDHTNVFTFIFSLLFASFGLIGVSIAFQIITYVALWRIFALYDDRNATLYLVLSIFFSFLSPIFLFILRNRQPRFTAEERRNIM